MAGTAVDYVLYFGKVYFDYKIYYANFIKWRL